MKTFTRIIAAAGLLAFAGALFLSAPAMAADRINVGAKFFTEQYIVGEMIAKVLKTNGFKVKKNMGTGSTVTREALETGQIDIYGEYTGTAWTAYFKQETVIHDPQVLYEKCKEYDLKENNIVWLQMAPLNNTFALAIRKKDVEKFGKTISELTEYINSGKEDLLFGLDQEFYERPDGLPAMAETYGMNANKKLFKLMEAGLTYEAIGREQIDVAMVYATDGKIKKFDLYILEDDKDFFPVYNLCPTIRKEVLDKHPEIEDILKPVFAELDDTTMQQLNYEVDVEGKPAEMVAEMFLKEKGFIK